MSEDKDYSMKSWEIKVHKFKEFMETPYAKLDQRLRNRVNWGCNCHFRIDKEFWEVLNEMFDVVIGMWKEGKE